MTHHCVSMRYLPLLPVILALAACSGTGDGNNSNNQAEGGGGGGAAATQQSASDASSNAENALTPPTAKVDASTRVIGLEGLGDLRIGAPIPTKGGWAVRGAQTDSACRTISSPDYPGVYAIVVGDKVERITVGQRSDVKLAEGIGVGASEKDVLKAFPGFRSEPHKYEDAPAKYLTAPNAGKDSSGLRFEIGQGGKVKMIHVGMMPALGYVEGCA